MCEALNSHEAAAPQGAADIVIDIRAAPLLDVRAFVRRSIVDIQELVAMLGIHFIAPSMSGPGGQTREHVTWTGRTSIEVWVQVEAEDVIAGQVTLTNSATIVYVALDDTGKPTEVAPLALVTSEDQRLWHEGSLRQQGRLRGQKRRGPL